MKKILALLFAVVVVAVMALTTAVPVIGVDNTSVNTTATIGGTNVPWVCAKFETPDHDTAPGTQILPMAGADRTVLFYVVVGANNLDKINRVDVSVKYSDPVEKFQLSALKDGTWTGIKTVPGTPGSTPINVRLVPYTEAPGAAQIDMNADGDTTDPEDLAVKEALTALDTQARVTYGKNQSGVAFNLASVLYDLKNNKQFMLELTGAMSNCQPAQDYIVDVTPISWGANGATVRNTFTYKSIVALQIDFGPNITFGNVTVGQQNVIWGDADGATTDRPSVKNIGNDKGKIQLKFSYMTNAEGKTIEDFDGQLGASGYFTKMKALVGTVLLNGLGGLATELPACTWTQLDLSVDPPSTAYGGTYSGSVEVKILHY